eukprot:TRINITY_DN42904_c0_g1_i1.p1 TRINITY_DN42904_c0_g1~~TRINITY_DN42904_c0_g1_i1.p1  ORF type:complete len:109 (+),score=24.61 TRINITY_DN42904_c0_g1_i1:50-376(+)
MFRRPPRSTLSSSSAASDVYKRQRNDNGKQFPLPSPVEDIATFLLVRGEYAWMGYGWLGCTDSYERPPELNTDVGTPVDATCREASTCLLYTSPSPRDRTRSRMPSSA